MTRRQHDNEHQVAIRGGFRGQRYTALFPLGLIDKARFVDALISKFGRRSLRYVSRLRRQVRRARVLIGVSSLGWTKDLDAFVYGRKIYRVQASAPRYRFIPQDTELDAALDDLMPVGSRKRQYQQLRRLRKRSRLAQLVLALASVTPFLEILGAPTMAFHLSGKTGLGKTTLLRVGVSLFLNPDSSLVATDFSKDTPNSIDMKLGRLKNFPIVVDETTGRDPNEVNKAAYDMVSGRSKSRLTSIELGYQTAPQLTYALVCFLSGERPRRHSLAHGGSAARWMEFELQEPIFTPEEIADWYDFSRRHYGWVGRDLIGSVIRTYGDSNGLTSLKRLYDKVRRRLARRLHRRHPRMIEILALVEVGDYIAARQLFEGFRAVPLFKEKSRRKHARQMAMWTDRHLAKETTTNEIIDAMAQIPRVGLWVSRGYIPAYELKPVAKEYGLTSGGALGRFLRQENLITKSAGRKILKKGQRVTVYAYILSPEGKRRLTA